MKPQKLKNNPTFQSASGCADPKIAPDLPKRPVNFFLAEYENYLEDFIFHKKVLSELEKNGSAIFHS